MSEKTKNVTSISEAPSYPDRQEQKRKMYRNRRIAAGVLLAAGATAAVQAGNAVVDAMTGPSATEKIEQAVEANPVMLNGKVILHEGVNLRSEPNLKNDNNADGSEGSVERQVPAGEAVVLDHPVMYTSEANQDFLGGLDKEGDYVWVAASELESQERTSGNDYITYVMDQNVEADKTPGNYSDGHFYQGVTQEQVAGTISSIPTSELDEIIPDYK